MWRISCRCVFLNSYGISSAKKRILHSCCTSLSKKKLKNQNNNSDWKKYFFEKEGDRVTRYEYHRFFFMLNTQKIGSKILPPSSAHPIANCRNSPLILREMGGGRWPDRQNSKLKSLKKNK